MRPVSPMKRADPAESPVASLNAAPHPTLQLMCAGQGSKLRQWETRVLPQLKWRLCLQVSTKGAAGSVLDVAEGTAARLQAMFFCRRVIFGSMTVWPQAILDNQSAAPRHLLLSVRDQEAGMDIPDML